MLLWCHVAASFCGAATIEEHFASNPVGSGWHIHGDAGLFRWNTAGETLEVTWDSSKTNSLFHRPLGTILSQTDDFSLEFDLRLNDIAIGVNSNKPSTFELAIGLANLADLRKTNFLRGTGINPAVGPRNLVEFDYFPDSGFGATISPTMISSNNQFAVGFNFPLALTPGDLFGVKMTYTASNQTLATVMTQNGQPFGPIKDVALEPGFSDFRLDAIAVTSYSDEGADGSLLAHGVVDNIIVTVPEPPVSSIAGAFADGLWGVEFRGRTNWVYTLDWTDDFRSWLPVSSFAPEVDGWVLLTDPLGIAPRAFYRVRASRL
jgi:hypothetical protein